MTFFKIEKVSTGSNPDFGVSKKRYKSKKRYLH